MRWDPAQYAKYADERNRPFDELLARVDRTYRGAEPPAYVVDLGCGPGNLTRRLAERWPGATVEGIDSSPDMIAAAAEHELPGRLSFRLGDVAQWSPDRPVDVVFASAVLHWLPGHVDLLPRFAEQLHPEHGLLAFQVPDNFTEPSHTLLQDLRQSPRWRDRVGEGADRRAGVERPERYLAALLDAGLSADVWQTEYFQLLHGDDAVLEWVKGTALRPVLSVLDEAEQAEFLSELAPQLRAAYPPGPHGTVFPFRRTFAIGRR